MVESASDFPFRQLIFDKFLIMDVMTYVDHQEIMKHMFAVNRQTRLFIEYNYTAIKNAFINDGLITY